MRYKLAKHWKGDHVVPEVIKEEGVIQRMGVSYKYLHYQSPEFRQIWMNLKQKYGETPVHFIVNPNDLSKIYVYDEFNKKYIEAHCTTMEYAKGLRLNTHLANIEMTRKQLNYANYEMVDEKKRMVQKQIDDAKGSLKRVSGSQNFTNRVPKGEKHDERQCCTNDKERKD